MVAAVREVFAHDAVLALEGDGDVQAPGAAITVALCGHWEHEPPCPLAPHHTAPDRDGDMVRLRVLFAAEPEDEAEVRRRIRDAVARAQLTAPDGTATRWRVVSTTPGIVRPEESEHGRGLSAG